MAAIERRVRGTIEIRALAFVVASPILLAALVVSRAPLLTWLICCSALLLAATLVRRSAGRRLVAALTAFSLLLSVLELVGEGSDPGVKLDLQTGLTIPKLVVGWGPEAAGVYSAGKTRNSHRIYDVRYTIDQSGYRPVDAGLEGPGTAFLGDSFIFGVGVNDAETLPQLFADRAERKLPVFNLGMGAFSPAQILAMMQTGIVDDVLARSELLVEFVAPWHAERSACRRRWVAGAPRYEVVGDEVRYAGVCREPAFGILEASSFYRYVVEPWMRVVDAEDIAQLVAITKETIRLARDKYHKPIIVYYKHDPDFLSGLGWTDDAIIAAFRSAGADVLDYSFRGDNTDTYRFAYDGHPTGAANAVHAKVLAQHIEESYPRSEVAKALGGGTVSGER